MAPLAYRDRVRAADEAIAAQRWADAARLYGEAVAAYPYDGRTWRRLGVALYRVEGFAQAGLAFAQAHRFGLSAYPETNAANAATAFARAGDAPEAVRWLRIALETPHLAPDNLLSRSEFDAIRSTAEFEALAASRRPGPVGDRAERWQRDLDALVAEVRRVKLVPRVGRSEADAFLAAAAALRPRFGELSDAQAVIELQRLMALMGQGHNGAVFPFLPQTVGETTFRRLPLSFYAFPTGYYVVGGDEAHRDLVGARVERVGRLTPDEVMTRSAAFAPRDNDMALVWSGVGVLGATTVLHAMGATDDPDRARFQLRMPDGSVRRVTVDGLADVPNAKMGPPASHAGPAPRYLRNVPESFWFEQLRPGVTYFQFNQVTPTNGGFDQGPEGRLVPRTNGERIDAFAQRLAQHLAATNTTTLIIDLRHNNGGNTYVYTGLLRALIAFDERPGTQIYAITGRNTFSAATNFVVDLDRMTDALFAGEPMSGSAIQPGDSMDVTLPHNQARFFIATIDWALQSPWDTRIWIAPDLPVVLTADDYFGNRDPIIDLVLADADRMRG